MFWKAVGTVLFAVAAAAPAHAGPLTADAQRLHDWVVKTRDHQGGAFAIVDKKSARLYVFDAQGQLRGDSAALLGQAPGDASAPNIDEHTQQGHVPYEERTTPAGRFVAEPGVNLTGEHIVWVDYDSAFAIHRVRPGRSMPERLRRLASEDAADHRASWGCVVVPGDFYESVVQRWLGRGRPVVYVMPESGSAAELMGDM